MTFTAKYGPMLRWWLFFTLIGLGCFVLIVSGALHKIGEVDVTRISFLILAIFLIFSIRTGQKTYALCRLESAGALADPYQQDDELGWFVSDMLLTMGMIGTVIGFIYMLGTSFQEFDPGNTGSLKQVMAKMSTGMSTALYTTASGLICSLLLKLQLFNYSHQLARLTAAQDSPEERSK